MNEEKPLSLHQIAASTETVADLLAIGTPLSDLEAAGLLDVSEEQFIAAECFPPDRLIPHLDAEAIVF